MKIQLWQVETARSCIIQKDHEMFQRKGGDNDEKKMLLTQKPIRAARRGKGRETPTLLRERLRGGGIGSRMEVGSQQQASQIQPNYGQDQFVSQLVTGSMIGEQESNKALKGVKYSPPTKKHYA